MASAFMSRVGGVLLSLSNLVESKPILLKLFF